jgi:hypothetical protein
MLSWNDKELARICDEATEVYKNTNLPGHLNFLEDHQILERMFLGKEFCDMAGIPQDKVYSHSKHIRAGIAYFFLEQIKDQRRQTG